MARWLTRLLVLALVLAALWLAGLALLGELGARRAALRVQATLAAALGAKVRLGGVDLGLVRGRLELAELELERASPGALRVALHHARLEVAPLGLALWRRDRAEALVVDRAELAISAWGMLAPPPAGALRLSLERFDLRAITLRLAPSLLAPDLGAATLTIKRATGGAVVLRSAASWLLALDELDAELALPGGVTAHLGYRGAPVGRDGVRRGTLSVRSTRLRAPLALPLTLPAVVDGDELAAMRQLGAQLLRAAATRKASALLRWLGR
jgi:hypothetical protein